MASFTPQEIEQFLQQFFDVVGTRQYIGARYVPILGRKGEDTIEWDNRSPYEPLTIVTYRGNSYTSRQYVPVGVLIDDTNYWVLTGNYNGQVEAYREEMQRAVAHVDSELESMHNYVDSETTSARNYVDDSIEEIEGLIPTSEFSSTNTVKNYIDAADEKKVPFPVLPESVLGTVGQVLSTLTNGKTKWVDPVIPDATDVANAVSTWLNDHPEATTTVLDGSVTNAKVNNTVFRTYYTDTIGASNYQSVLGIDDINDIPKQIGNSYIFLLNDITENMLANLPKYGTYCMLMTFDLNYAGDNSSGATQFASYINTADQTEIYWRCSRGTGNTTWWADWKRLWPVDLESIPKTYFDGPIVSTINSSTYQQYGVTNLDTIPSQFGSSFIFLDSTITQSMVANMPIYGRLCALLTFQFSRNFNNGGCVQLAFIEDSNEMREIYVRESYGASGGAGTWHPWRKIYFGDQVFKSPILERTTIARSNYASYGIYDANTIPATFNSSILMFNTDIRSEDVANLPKYGCFNTLLTFQFTPKYNNSGCIQICASFNNENSVKRYVRVSYGNENTTYWEPWREITTEIQNVNLRTVDIFKKVVCCGDSFTSGHIQISGSTTTTNEDYAWPHYMETITGNEYINCGHSGTTVLTWPTANRGLPKAQAAGPAQAYIIGLMINDVNFGETLGTPSDIGTQAETYYGGLSRIVEALHAISNDAHIFIQTCPREGTSWDNFNQAVIDVVEYYKNTMHTHLLELRDYSDLYKIPSITSDSVGGHFTAIGYQQFAMILARVMSEYINSHISAFQSVHLIPTA